MLLIDIDSMISVHKQALRKTMNDKSDDDIQQDDSKPGNKPLSYLDKQLAAAKDKVEGVRAKATGSWNKVEKAFDDRVSKALHRLNIPTRNDIETLLSRVDVLEKDINAFSEDAKRANDLPSNT